jgi:hypothetical protein
MIVIAGLDPAIHHFRKKIDHRVSALRAGPVMTAFNQSRRQRCAAMA